MNRSHSQPEPTIAEQAAEWVCKLDEAGPGEQTEFRAWLKQSPHHVEEFLFASALYRELEGVDPQRKQDIHALMAQEVQNIVPLLPQPIQIPASKTRTSKRTWRTVGWAAGFALAAISLFAVRLVTSGSQTYSTSVGEQHVFELDDGSVVHMNARSQIKTQWSDSARDIQLIDGEALFKVASDPIRPFRVHAGDAVIQAIGTQFNVYRRTSGTSVAVIEGAVRVSRPAGSVTQLAAGEEVSISPTGQITPVAVDTERATAWRQRRLVFKEDSLADVAAEFNRYNRIPQVQVEGQSTAERKLTAVFDADAPESLIRFLQGDGEFSIERNGDTVVIRTK